MRTARTLILVQALFAISVGMGMALFGTGSFPAGSAIARPFEAIASLRFFGMGFGGLGLALWTLRDLAPGHDRRRLAAALCGANVLGGLMAFFQQTAVWESPWGWLLVLIHAALALGFGELALREAEGAGGGPAELERSWQRRIGETAAQEERNRLARDLHDSIKQQLFSIQVGAAAIQERWDRDTAGAKAAVAEVRRSAHEAMVEMQALLLQLRPRALAAMGLVEALREQCEALGYRSGAAVAVDLGDIPSDERLPAGSQEGLFRIAQEALANVARHARARRVRVTLGESAEQMVLAIEDDGQGFDARAPCRGMGLRNLGERAGSLGGSLELASEPGVGTRITVRVPLPPAADTPLSIALRAEHWVWPVPIALGLAALAVDRSPAAAPHRVAVESGAAIVVLLLAAAWSWGRVRRASRRAPLAAAGKLAWLRHLAHRNRLFLFFLTAGWTPWSWRLAEEGWSPARLAWLALGLCCLGLATAELAALHRWTAPAARPARRRGIPRLLRRAMTWGAGMALLFELGFLIDSPEPAKLALALGAGGLFAYVKLLEIGPAETSEARG